MTQLLSCLKFSATVLICGFCFAVNAQSNDSLSFSAYIEAYHNIDFNAPNNNLRPGLFYSYTRTGQPNINLALAKLKYQGPKWRANLGVMAGSYAEFNLAAEPKGLRNFFEANVGVRLSKTKELWLDAGILPSHIGFETAIGKDNWAVSRSMCAENSPYFETGLKLSYLTEKWDFALLALTGWQTIKMPEGSNSPGFGAQVAFRPDDKSTINYSNYFGAVPFADSVGNRFSNYFRTFHNVYYSRNVINEIQYMLGVDIGWQENSGRRLIPWWTPYAMLRFKNVLGGKWSFNFRHEQFFDTDNIYIGALSANQPNLAAINLAATSFNVDYQINKFLLLRTEAKWLKSKDAILPDKQKFSASNFNWLTTLSFAWN
jgi:hypothetical protein